MGQFEKFIQETEFMHNFEGRRMNCVTAEVAQEVSVLFEHNNVNPCPCEQKSQHHAGWSATGDTAARRDRLNSGSQDCFFSLIFVRYCTGRNLIYGASVRTGISSEFACVFCPISMSADTSIPYSRIGRIDVKGAGGEAKTAAK